MTNPLSRFLWHRETNETPKGIRGLLRKVPIFSDLKRNELAAVERILHQREYQPEEVIFRQEEPGMGMYIIETGRVDIISESSQTLLAELSDGDFFGEMALLDDSPRSATAIARTSCRLFGFFQPDLLGLVDRNPRLGVKIVLRLARTIARRLRRSISTIPGGPEIPGAGGGGLELGSLDLTKD